MGKARGKKKKRGPVGLISLIILMLCLIVFAGSAAYLLGYFLENNEAQEDMVKVSQLKIDGINAAYSLNSDIVGWIDVEGTKIDYPVMHTPGEPEYYLRKNFNKEYSLAGTPFLDANSVIAGEPQAEADARSTCNLLIYGHNMKTGIMFHSLVDYKDEKFYKKHKEFTFTRAVLDPETGEVTGVDETYEVIAACYSQIYSKSSKAFKYYKYAGFYDEDTFDEYVDGVKAEACYDTGISAEYGDQLITLSTCAYHVENGRFYIVGRRK